MPTGKKEAQSMVEMLDGMQRAKEEGLSPRRGQSIYKQQSAEFQKGELQKLIGMSIQELAEVATSEKININDVDELKKRTLIYLRACEEAGTFPSQMGLAKSIGYTDRSLRAWRQKNPTTPTAVWLEQFSDTCSDILTQSALNNNCNSIVSIFTHKALFGLRETSEFIITPSVQEAENEYNPEEIRRRYLIDDKRD